MNKFDQKIMGQM